MPQSYNCAARSYDFVARSYDCCSCTNVALPADDTSSLLTRDYITQLAVAIASSHTANRRSVLFILNSVWEVVVEVMYTVVIILHHLLNLTHDPPSPSIRVTRGIR